MTLTPILMHVMNLLLCYYLPVDVRTIPAPARDRRPRAVVIDAHYERIMYGLETLAMKASLRCSEHVGSEIETLHSGRKSTSYTITLILLVHCDKGKPDDTNPTAQTLLAARSVAPLAAAQEVREVRGLLTVV